MKKTLVLVVDRDDDYGVKGKVNTPIIGVQACLDAATAFGIADPEDSDLNALYAAVSICLEIQEDSNQADVALICGDESVGHKSDLALVAQLDEVLDQIKPDSVVLVGDGAEDEYIYPIISSRTHVDSVRKVYVKQAPGLEGMFYIVKKMMTDKDKRKRFMVPLGHIMVLLSLFFLIPGIFVYLADSTPGRLSALSGPFAFFTIGVIILCYGYDVTERMSLAKMSLKVYLTGRTTPLIFLCISVAFIIIMAVYSFMEVGNLYLKSTTAKIVYFMSSMVWPIIMSLVIYQAGIVIERFLREKQIGLLMIFSCLGLASIGLSIMGLMDIALSYLDVGYGLEIGVFEIVIGVMLSFLSSLLKLRLDPVEQEAAENGPQ